MALETCQRCYKVVERACRNDTETLDCRNLQRKEPQRRAADEMPERDFYEGDSPDY